MNRPPANSPTRNDGYKITSAARQDLTFIRKYLTQEAGKRVAASTLRKIKEAFGLISRTPGVGHTREDLADNAVKFWTVFSYMIVYDPSKRPIEILRVLHGNRDLSALLARDDE